MGHRGLAFVLLGLVLMASLAMGVFIVGSFTVYPGYRTRKFHEAESDKPVKCVVQLEHPSPRPVTIEDPEWIGLLGRSWSGANYHRPNHPHGEKAYYLRVTRASSRVDQYLVSLDRRGEEYDYFYVVNRSGNSTQFGSAFRAPGLRRLFDHPLLK